MIPKFENGQTVWTVQRYMDAVTDEIFLKVEARLIVDTHAHADEDEVYYLTRPNFTPVPEVDVFATEEEAQAEKALREA